MNKQAIIEWPNWFIQKYCVIQRWNILRSMSESFKHSLIHIDLFKVDSFSNAMPLLCLIRLNSWFSFGFVWISSGRAKNTYTICL